MSPLPIRFRHAVHPLIAVLRETGFDRAFTVAAGYDPATVASWRVEVASRYDGSRQRRVWTSTEVEVVGQTIRFDYAPDEVSGSGDDAIELDEVLALSLCRWSLAALDDQGEMLWAVMGPVDFVSTLQGLEGAAAIGSPIVIRLDEETTISLTILGNTPGGGSVDNAAVVAAIEEDPAASRDALELGSAALAEADAFAVADDERLADARTPTEHAASHATGGEDSLTPAAIGAATAEQGALAATAVQPGSSPTFDTVRANYLGGADFSTIHVRALYLTGVGFAKGDQVVVGNNNHVYLFANVDGVLQVQGYAFSEPLNRICLGLSTSAYPALKRVGTQIQARLGDDSAAADFSASDLIAHRYLRPASYTVAAANALVGVPTDALIVVADESGGSTLAKYDGTNWRRQTDLAVIS